jgi:hypothetical protein
MYREGSHSNIHSRTGITAATFRTTRVAAVFHLHASSNSCRPPLQYFGHGDQIGGTAQQIDGFSCEGCTVTTGVLIYGGGAYNLPGTKFPQKVTLFLTGSALNTFKFLTLTGVIPRPTPRRAPPKPQVAELEISAHPNAINLVSLEGIKK